MSRFEDPVIITCSISGAVANREQCPAIPYTPEEYAAEARRIVDADRKVLRDFLVKQSGLSAVWTDWGTTSFVQLEDGNADDFLERLRAEFDTSAVPGRYFEMPDYFRIGMGVNTEMFAEGLNRIGRALGDQ